NIQQKQVKYGTLLNTKPRHNEDILNKFILDIIREDPRLFKKYIILQRETNLIKKEHLINELIDELIGAEKLLIDNPAKKRPPERLIRKPNNYIKHKSEESGDANGMFKAKGLDEHGVGAKENKASGWCLKQVEGGNDTG
ncbi:21062_t:CDS:2, partial [Cetraspora pellucida]